MRKILSCKTSYILLELVNQKYRVINIFWWQRISQCFYSYSL